MTDRPLSRRQFLGSAAVIGTTAVAPSSALGPSDLTPIRPSLPHVTLAPEELPTGVARQFGAARFRDFDAAEYHYRFSPDSRWVIWLQEGRCCGYELATARRITFRTQIETGWSESLECITSDGRVAVSEKKAVVRRLRFYDLSSGQPHPPTEEKKGDVRAVSPDGRTAVVERASEEETVQTGVELATGRTIWTLTRKASLQPTRMQITGRVAWSTFVFPPKGGEASDDYSVILDIVTGRQIRIEHPPGEGLRAATSIWCSTDQRRLLACVESHFSSGVDRAVVWDTASGRLLSSFALAQSETVFGITPDGKCFFGLIGEDRQLVLRDATSGRITRRYAMFGVGWVHTAVSPDGKTLFVWRNQARFDSRNGPDNTLVRLIDADTGATLPQSPDPPGPILRVWFPTRDTTAAAFRTRVGHLDYVRWDTATGRGRRITDPTDRNEPTRTADLDPVPLAAPDLEHFLRADGSHLVVLHGETGKVIARREQPSAANGRWFWLDSATVGIFALDGLHLWSWATDTSRVLPLELPGKWPHVWRWRASADGRTLAVQFFPNLTGRACMVAWVDVPTGKVTTTEFGENACGDWFAASVDTNRLAVQLGKEMFHVHDRSGWRGMFRVPNAMSKCDLTACGRTLAVYRDEIREEEGERIPAAFELWEVTTGQRRWSRPVDRAFDDLRASPCGRFVATCRADQPVYLWDVFGEVSDPQPEPTDGQRVWDALGATDAEVAFRTVRQLVQHPTAAVRLLSAKLKPAEAPKQAWVDERIDRLGHHDFHTRQAAEKELTAHADVITDYLRTALEAGLDTEEAEVRLQRIVGRAMAPLDHVRSMRAVEVLEYAGEAGGPLLSRLANGTPGLLTREATAAIRRRDR